MKNRKKIHDDWETPKWLLDRLTKEFGEMFDPCPINPKFDGLKVKWKKVNFINPPYNLKDKTAFCYKAFREAEIGKTCILLLPVATETKLFMDIWNQAHEVRFIYKRLKFKGYNSKGKYVTDKTGQSGSMLVILKGKRSWADPEFSMMSE